MPVTTRGKKIVEKANPKHVVATATSKRNAKISAAIRNAAIKRKRQKK